MQEIQYIIVADLNKRILLRKDIGLIYEEDKEYKTYRTYFFENFGTLEKYMNTAVEKIKLNKFPIKTRELMRKDDYNGKYVNKITLVNGKVISHFYTFIGINENKEINIIPYKIPIENKFTIDPRKIISSIWYYLESYEKDYTYKK